MKTVKYFYLCLFLALISCEKDDNQNPYKKADEGFLSFSTNGQTILSTAINNNKQEVKFEIESDVDITRLVPKFEVPSGISVYINGVEQVSENSVVDFSQPVIYELKDLESRKSDWLVSAAPLSKKIVIDASHDGGVWWFPQSEFTGFDTAKYHQGKLFADLLRKKGFIVDELGRDSELKEEQFMGFFIVIRVNGFQAYSPKELDVYTKLVKRGMNLVFFTDHKKYNPKDELGDLLGLNFEGIAHGTVSKFAQHTITKNLESLDYVAGSVITNADQNPDIEILGWLGEDEYADLNLNGIKDNDEPFAPPVMGILNYPKSKVFFIGDANGLQIMPQPFIDNLIEWMSD
jgi:hypothetical protein